MGPSSSLTRMCAKIQWHYLPTKNLQRQSSIFLEIHLPSNYAPAADRSSSIRVTSRQQITAFSKYRERHYIPGISCSCTNDNPIPSITRNLSPDTSRIQRGIGASWPRSGKEMPNRGRVALVACEPCRRRKVKVSFLLEPQLELCAASLTRTSATARRRYAVHATTDPCNAATHPNLAYLGSLRSN